MRRNLLFCRSLHLWLRMSTLLWKSSLKRSMLWKANNLKWPKLHDIHQYDIFDAVQAYWCTPAYFQKLTSLIFGDQSNFSMTFWTRLKYFKRIVQKIQWKLMLLESIRLHWMHWRYSIVLSDLFISCLVESRSVWYALGFSVALGLVELASPW